MRMFSICSSTPATQIQHGVSFKTLWLRSLPILLGVAFGFGEHMAQARKASGSATAIASPLGIPAPVSNSSTPPLSRYRCTVRGKVIQP